MRLNAPFRRRLVSREYPAPRTRTRRARLSAAVVAVVVLTVISLVAMLFFLVAGLFYFKKTEAYFADVV